VAADRPGDGSFTSFPRESMAAVARAAMPDVAVVEAQWLTAYDGYYYSSSESRPLPVLRVRFADPQETWVYVDPSRGGVVQRSEKVTRLRRWLYQGLHSLDFPALYYKRPLWDMVVIALSIGGLEAPRQARASPVHGACSPPRSKARRARAGVTRLVAAGLQPCLSDRCR
jgi:hypothetical protein